MKTDWFMCSMVAVTLLLVLTAPTLGEEATFRPGIGIGIMACPGYNSYLEDADTGHSSAALVDLVVSSKLRIGGSWALVPAVEMLMTTESFTETIGFFTASLSVRYSFTEEPSFYLQAGPNYVVSQGGDVVEEFKGGVGGVASIGYAFKGRDRSRFGPELEVGYSYMSVDAASPDGAGYQYSYSRGEGGTTTENFGGAFLRVGLRF